MSKVRISRTNDSDGGVFPSAEAAEGVDSLEDDVRRLPESRTLPKIPNVESSTCWIS